MKDSNYLLGYKTIVCLACNTFRNGNTKRCPVCDQFFHTPVHDGYFQYTELVTEDEVRKIDPRIQWLIVNNPTFNSLEYCCQIGFIYRLKKGADIRPNGKLNMLAQTKGELLEKITRFFNRTDAQFDILPISVLENEGENVT